nr:MAG: putative coat protein [Leviviridae sp.]
MLGDTLTVTYDGSGGTAVVTSKINQDAYSANYLKKDTLFETRVTVKHIKETVKAGTQAFDRHTVTFEQFVYPTEAKPLGVLRSASLTIRNDPSDTEASVTDLGEALTYWATDVNLAKLFGWES